MGNYSNTNPDLLARADITAKTVLEIGCGSGQFARAFLDRNPGATYIGIEYVKDQAKLAKPYLAKTITANIEDDATFNKIDRALEKSKVDLLIIGNVLEHLIDPYSVMERLHERMAANGQAQICISNTAHWSMIMRLLRGDWTYEDNGLLDRSHLRFFTRKTMAQMFRDSGWAINAISPRIFNREKGMKHAHAFAKLGQELGFDPNVAANNMLPLQWVFGLSAKPRKTPKSIYAIGIGTQIDALSKIRLRQPLHGLAASGGYKPKYQIGEFKGLENNTPDILLSYRLHPNPPQAKALIDQRCRDGMLFIHDVDDHPEYLKGQKANNFWSIRAAHAVTVSTPSLVDLCQKWNPNVHLVPNQILESSAREIALAKPDGKPTIFFGALNREDEWKAQCQEVIDLLQKKPKLAKCKTIHEPSLHNALGDGVDREFVPTQTYEGFIRHLASCDIALSPLFETEFNACKSDLKLIECLAHGVVPICSEYAAAQTSIPKKYLMIANKPGDWAEHLAKLCENPNDLAKRKEEGFEWLRKNRMWSQHAPKLDKLYQSFLKDLPDLETQRQKRLGKDVTK